MRRSALSVLVVAFALSGCGGGQKKPDDKTGIETPPEACQACSDAKKAGKGWCTTHGMGYAGGKATSCALCAKAGTLDEGCTASAPKPCSECAAKMSDAR
jgi:hypothetical protein